MNLALVNDRELARARAYTFWEEAGRPEGQSQEFWLKAARMLKLQVDLDKVRAGHEGRDRGHPRRRDGSPTATVRRP